MKVADEALQESLWYFKKSRGRTAKPLCCKKPGKLQGFFTCDLPGAFQALLKIDLEKTGE